jgi:putative membrane protein
MLGAMPRFILHWATTGIALVVTDWMLDGVRIRSGVVLAVAALVVGLVNAVVRPILLVLTLPLTLATLGLFYLVVNGVAFGIAAALVPGFDVASFGTAVIAALLVSLVSWFVGSFARGPSARVP